MTTARYEPDVLQIKTEATTPRTFTFTPHPKGGVWLMAERKDRQGKMQSVTGHIDQNDLVKLVAFLTAAALGVTGYGLVQSTDETK